MMKYEMTVHRALAELKTIGERIEKAINTPIYTMAVKHSAEKINGVPVKELTERIKSDYQSVNDLMARREAMKRAVVLSNASTKVKIGDVEYTVAEAIEMKNHGMEYKKQLKQRLVNCYRAAQVNMENNSGEALEKKAEQYVLSVIQAQPKDAKMAVDSDAMKAVRKTYIDNNTYDLIDPIKVMDVIKALDDEINAFETEVDAALSVSNAVTVIEFEC